MRAGSSPAPTQGRLHQRSDARYTTNSSQHRRGGPLCPPSGDIGVLGFCRSVGSHSGCGQGQALPLRKEGCINGLMPDTRRIPVSTVGADPCGRPHQGCEAPCLVQPTRPVRRAVNIVHMVHPVHFVHLVARTLPTRGQDGRQVPLYTKQPSAYTISLSVPTHPTTRAHAGYVEQG